MSEVKYVVYRRLSKEDKSRTQHGFEAQMIDINRFISEKGGTIIGNFKEYVSGGESHKVELEKAMTLCIETGAELLVSKLCRLSRRVSQIATYMEGSVKFRVATMASANNFMLHLYSALNEEDRANIRSRVVLGLQAAKDKGVKIGGSNEKWHETYQKNKAKGLHKRPQFIQSSRDNAQPIVKEITNIIKYSKGNVTQAQICEHLNSSGLKTARGGEFTPPTVSRMIKKFNIEYSNKTKYDGLS